MSKPAKWKIVDTYFSKEDFVTVKIMPVSTTKKLLWGLWSKSETEIYMFKPGGIYTLDNTKVEELKQESK